MRAAAPPDSTPWGDVGVDFLGAHWRAARRRRSPRCHRKVDDIVDQDAGVSGDVADHVS